MNVTPISLEQILDKDVKEFLEVKWTYPTELTMLTYDDLSGDITYEFRYLLDDKNNTIIKLMDEALKYDSYYDFIPEEITDKYNFIKVQ